MPALHRCLILSAVALLLFGCAAAEDYLSSINPFTTHEKPLEGQRQAILSPDPSAQAPIPSQIKPVTVPSATSVPDWPNPGGPPDNSPANIAVSAGNGIAWKVSSEGLVRVSAPPIISNGFVYVYDNRRVTAYDLNSGKRAWSSGITTKNSKTSVPGGGIATDGRAVYVASGLRILRALDIVTGKEIWSYDLPDPARSAPTVADGRVYVVSATGVVSAYATDSGRELWHYANPIQAGGLLSVTSPAVRGNLVAVPFSSGELVGLDAGSGAVLWSASLLSPQPVSALTSLNDVAARPVISGNAVYAGSVAGRLIAVQAGNGAKIWEQGVSTAFTPVVAGNGVFVLSLTGDLYAFDAATGEVRWAVNLPKDKERTVWAGPVLANSSLWLISNSGTLVSVDAGTGLVLSQQNLKDGAALSPVAASGKLVIATLSGGLIALR
jgi:outer membrane protein assembly factor BamB